jgi:hypothetical protein
MVVDHPGSGAVAQCSWMTTVADRPVPESLDHFANPENREVNSYQTDMIDLLLRAVNA